MKRKSLAMAVAGIGIGAAALPAGAQSSVTLYGIVDSGITYTNNQKGHAAWQATGGNEQGARWGLVGREDIGGGTSAVFRLENGFNIENGAASQGGRLFGRRAYVGLSNDRWGTFTMGRQYNAVQETLEPLQIGASTALTQYALHPFDTDDLNNTFRTNNSVQYQTPDWGGVRAIGTYGFSNSTSFAQNRTWSVGASYTHGPLQLGAAYVRVDHPAIDATGAIASDNYYTFVKGVARQQIWGAGGAYTWGGATFGLLYTSSLFSLQTGGAERFNNFEGSVRYRVTPAVQVAFGETYTQVLASHAATHNAHYLQTNAGVQYFLSKRTDVYLNAFYQRASSNTVAAIEGISNPSSTRTQIVAVTGIRHKF
ncbi:porin [Burkholderia mayonis]|uniref:Porin n=1 Tax=Burkholderia mayonis TaxID=1385591 RepID=A0A1B4FVL1_9BURK|nr:porin [Burkholderia mayonis]AOJ07720.1 porin [Burkholderia mayonis]KVE58873.1 porin [Burkholderia mayonis]